MAVKPVTRAAVITNQCCKGRTLSYAINNHLSVKKKLC